MPLSRQGPDVGVKTCQYMLADEAGGCLKCTLSASCKDGWMDGWMCPSVHIFLSLLCEFSLLSSSAKTFTNLIFVLRMLATVSYRGKNKEAISLSVFLDVLLSQALMCSLQILHPAWVFLRLAGSACSCNLPSIITSPSEGKRHKRGKEA